MLDYSVYKNTDKRRKELENFDNLDFLIEKAKEGDGNAFGKLYDLFFDRIYKFIFFRISHKEVAEDITEEVFIKAYQALAKLKEDQAFESWLYQISRNKLIDYYRSKKSLVDISQVENELVYDFNLSESIDKRLEEQKFLEALELLPEDQKTVIQLKFIEDLENPEIAIILNKTEGSIRVIQHRAITKLKDILNSSRK